MFELEDLYFDWLLTKLHPEGVSEEVAYLGDLLHHCEFRRRVGRDINRASDGANLRKEFLLRYEDADISPHVTNDFMMAECTWLEMLVALSVHIDFIYDGGVEKNFLDLIKNLGLDWLARFGHIRCRADQELVDRVTHNFDNNYFDRNGHGGLFPLHKPGHLDQRTVEIWDQQAAYFRERLEGVLWTSTR